MWATGRNFVGIIWVERDVQNGVESGETKGVDVVIFPVGDLNGVVRVHSNRHYVVAIMRECTLRDPIHVLCPQNIERLQRDDAPNVEPRILSLRFSGRHNHFRRMHIHTGNHVSMP